MSCVTARVNKGKNHVIFPLGLQTDKFVCPENILKTFHERNETKKNENYWMLNCLLKEFIYHVNLVQVSRRQTETCQSVMM